MSRRSPFIAALLLGALLAGPMVPALAQSVVIQQAGAASHSLDRAAVEQLPAVQQQISFVASHGTETANYTGATLWSVLQKAAALSADPRTRLHMAIAVTGRDGYVALLALAEIDPEFENKPVLLAYRRGDKPLPNELRLVVPGDKRGGRSVRDVVTIELR